jgi:hypothetical protein
MNKQVSYVLFLSDDIVMHCAGPLQLQWGMLFEFPRHAIVT